jgi:lipoprotein-releasing system permease protein
VFFTFAKRYLTAKKSTQAINLIAWVSVSAITLVTAAMIVVMSAFNGLSNLVQSLYKGFYTDLRIIPASGKVIDLTPEKLAQIKAIRGVKTISLTAEEKALLKNQETQVIVTLKGVDTAYSSITNVASKKMRGDWNLGDAEKANLFLGYGVENALGLLTDRFPGQIVVYMPGRERSFTGRLDDFNTGEAGVCGTFAIQQDFDNKYALSNINFVKMVMGLDSNQYTAVEIGVLPGYGLSEVQNRVAQLLGNAFTVQTKFQQNPGLYNVMKYEKWGVYSIFLLVLIIASFNITGALTMLVLEKKKDISVLQAMGSTPADIQKIFLSQGSLLALTGITAGTLIAALLCELQTRLHLVKLGNGSFLVNHYPVSMEAFDILLIVSTVGIICLLAAWWPAKKASMQPLELRN